MSSPTGDPTRCDCTVPKPEDGTCRDCNRTIGPYARDRLRTLEQARKQIAATERRMG